MQKMQKMQCMGKTHTHFWARTTLMPGAVAVVTVTTVVMRDGVSADGDGSGDGSGGDGVKSSPHREPSLV